MELALLATYKVEVSTAQPLRVKLVLEFTEQTAQLANLATLYLPLLLGVAKPVVQIANSVQLLDQAFVIFAFLDITL